MVVESAPVDYRLSVGAMVINVDGLIWIGRRSDTDPAPEDNEGWWQMPQGGIDAGEDPRAAALRELREETGMSSVRILAETPDWLTYDLPPELQKKAWGGRYRGQKQRWYAMRFTGPATEIDLAPVDGQHAEFDAWRWSPIRGVLSLIVPFKREVYAEVIAQFRHLAVPA